MSAKTDRNTGRRDPATAGTCESGLRHQRPAGPAVFSATVLPPVFGPVMTSDGGRWQHPDVDGHRIGRRAWRVAVGRVGPAARGVDVGQTGRDVGHQQRVAGGQQLERAVGRQSGLHTVDDRRESGLGLDDVQVRRRLDGALQVEGAPPELIGQLQQDAPDFLRFLLLERDDVVVDLDRAQRLEEQAGAARRRAVDDARDRRAVLRAHDEDEAAVAVGDDLILEVLRRVAVAQERLERAAQPRLLASQAVAHRPQFRAGIVLDLARRVDLVPDVGDLGLERGAAFDDGLQDGEGALGAPDARRAWRRPTRGSHRAPASRSGSRARPSTARRAEAGREVGGRRQRERPHQFVEADAFGRGRQPLGHTPRVGRRAKRGQAFGAQWRGREPTHHVHDPGKFEGLQDGWLHLPSGIRGERRGSLQR